MNTDAKTTYAQSSDIKSRTYLEYRRDMKVKAIAELEILPWLQNKIKEKDAKSVVEKYGGDKFIWFLRKGGITREPDFVIRHPDGQIKFLEFQYAKQELGAYDFKVSKITPTDRKLKARVPKKDTEILYVIKPTSEFALLTPEWIAKNSTQTQAAAWGNAQVYRVEAQAIKKLMKQDEELKIACEMIDKKIAILDFQHQKLDQEKEKLSRLLQTVVDEDKLIKIMPRNLGGFYKVCFILDHIEKTPDNSSLWLVYLLSFLEQPLNSHELFMLIYCLDFLYPRIELEKNELASLVKKLRKIKELAGCFADARKGSFESDKNLAPIEETRNILFVINIIEDLTQDLLFYYGKDENLALEPVTRIFQLIPDVNKTFDFIQKAQSRPD